MDKLKVKYATYSKAMPPQPIRLKTPGWAGNPDKMEDGSPGQPWHCLPFVEASTYGLELIYQFDTECQIINDNGLVRIDWDFAKEPHRRKLDSEIEMARLQIADNVWHNSSGYQLSNHYKILAAAFVRDGQGAVEELVQKGVERHAAALPKDKTVAEYLAMASERLNQEKYDEAREIYTHVLSLDANNAEAFSHLGICLACKGLAMNGLKLMARAVAIAPNSPVYHGNMGELLRTMGKFPEAESCFRAALQLVPNDAGYMSVLGQIMVQQGKMAQGLELCRTAAKVGANNAAAQFRLGVVLAQQKQYAEARSAFT